MSLGSQKSALRMRDIIRTMVSAEIRRSDPKLGTVVDIDRKGNAASVILNGDTDVISAKSFNVHPMNTNDIVLIKGGPGQYYISDVMSGYGWNRSRWFQRVQDSLNGGGTLAWSSVNGNFTWSVRFLCFGVGDGYNPSGTFNIGPCVGGFAVPRYNSGDNTGTTTIANGVQINQTYQGLYYELPLDQPNPALFMESNFRLVGYNGLESFDVPEHWILIALRNDDGSSLQSLKVMNGKTL